MQLAMQIFFKQLDDALAEDFGTIGDITSQSLLSEDTKINFAITARQDIILSGIQIACYYLEKYKDVKFAANFQDGQIVKAGEKIITGAGNASSIFMVERVMLNYLQHLSAIATKTEKYVTQTIGTNCKIADTRKTIPSMRGLQKYAVRCGGGINHRPTLDGLIMIKDNHIAALGGVVNAIRRARELCPHYSKIEVECDTLEQVQQAVQCRPEIIMLDNMNLEQSKQAVSIIRKVSLDIVIEASGGIKIEQIAPLAQIGVDIISVGGLTHTVAAVDIGLDIVS